MHGKNLVRQIISTLLVHYAISSGSGFPKSFSYLSKMGLIVILAVFLRPLHAAPDPDLFDGRVGQVQDRSGSSGGHAAGEATSPSAPAESTAPAESVEGSGSSGPSSAAGRDFSEIGGLSGDTQAIEVNSSKVSSPPPEEGSSRSGSTATDGTGDPQRSSTGGMGGSGARPSKGRASGDYGETLPPGI